MNMKMISIIFAIILLFVSGCSSTLKTVYSPTFTPIYTEKINMPVMLRGVTDKRSMNPFTYYREDMDTGNFDRAITDIVREAVEKEFQRLGLQVLNSKDSVGTKNITIVDCEVLDFQATITKGFFSSDVLDLSVSIRFRWIDSKTSKVLEENERSMKKTQKIGFGNTPVLPMGTTQIKEYGNELINNLLLRVIEKELRLNKFLHKAS